MRKLRFNEISRMTFKKKNHTRSVYDKAKIRFSDSDVRNKCQVYEKTNCDDKWQTATDQQQPWHWGNRSGVVEAVLLRTHPFREE